MTWTILELNRNPPPERCCYLCNPNLASPFAAANPRDPRLLTFANDFKYGLTVPISRPGSSASIRTDVSNASSFIPVRPGVKVPQEEQEKLREKLINWRNQKHQLRGSPLFLSAQTILPPKQLNAFVSQSNRFLQEEIVTICLLRKLVPWDSATETDLAEIVSIISNWRDTATIVIPSTPASQRRARKKGRPGPEPTDLHTPRAPPIEQPTFTSRFRLPRPGEKTALSGMVDYSNSSPVANRQLTDENVFETPRPTLRPTPRPTRPMSHLRLAAPMNPQTIYETPRPIPSAAPQPSPYPSVMAPSMPDTPQATPFQTFFQPYSSVSPYHAPVPMHRPASVPHAQVGVSSLVPAQSVQMSSPSTPLASSNPYQHLMTASTPFYYSPYLPYYTPHRR